MLDQIQVDISSITLSPQQTSTWDLLQVPNLTPQHHPSPLEKDGDVDMPLQDDDPDDDGPDDDADVEMPCISSEKMALPPQSPPPAPESPPQPPRPAPDTTQYKLQHQQPKEDAHLPPPQASTSSHPIKRKKTNKDAGKDNACEETKPLSLTCTYECYNQYILAAHFLPSIPDIY